MSERYHLARIEALETELARVRRLLDKLGKEGPTVDGEGMYMMASKAGFIHSYGNSIWMGGEDCTESVYRLALMAAQSENETAARVCDDQRRQYEERATRPEKLRDIDPETAKIAMMTCDFISAAIRKRFER